MLQNYEIISEPMKTDIIKSDTLTTEPETVFNHREASKGIKEGAKA